MVCRSAGSFRRRARALRASASASRWQRPARIRWRSREPIRRTKPPSSTPLRYSSGRGYDIRRPRIRTGPRHVLMANGPSVWIVVLNWNGLADTLACLESLRGLQYPRHSIVVVDNGSSDGSLDALRRASASFGFDLIEAGSNLGYAGGNNLGIRHALERGADYVLILNN